MSSTPNIVERLRNLFAMSDDRARETRDEAATLIEQCVAAGFIAPDGSVPHIPEALRITKQDAQGMFEFACAHGALHTKECPGDDTCDCMYRLYNKAANKCCQFLLHFTAASARGGGE